MNEYEAKQQARRERFQARAEHLKNEWVRMAEETTNRFPGSIIAGPANYPVKRHEEAHRRVSAAYDRWKEAERAAETAGTSTAISSDDPDAIKKLTSELEQCKATHERMKLANKIIRKNIGDSKIPALINAGFSESEAIQITTPTCQGIGFPAYRLQYNNANIKRIEQRIANLERLKTAPVREKSTSEYTYREDPAENRAMFIFPGKPTFEQRNILKKHAFKWSPRRGAWVRQLTGNAQFAAQAVRSQLNDLANTNKEETATANPVG